MTACFVSPAVMNGQNDNYFRPQSDVYTRESIYFTLSNQQFGSYYNLTNQTFGFDDNGYNLTNQTFGQDAPLGGGLLILTAAGAGYAIIRRNKIKIRRKH